MDGEETLIDYQQHPEKPLKENLPGLKKNLSHLMFLSSLDFSFFFPFDV